MTTPTLAGMKQPHLRQVFIWVSSGHLAHTPNRIWGSDSFTAADSVFTRARAAAFAAMRAAVLLIQRNATAVNRCHRAISGA